MKTKKNSSHGYKNTIMRFLRDKLKMDDKTRNEIEIEDKNSISKYRVQDYVHPMYKLRRNCKNFFSCKKHCTIQPEGRFCGNCHPYSQNSIQQILRNRKLMYQLRQSSVGNIQTNIRLGKTDFILRQKLKTDSRKWKDIVPLEIPPHIPKPDLDLLKKTKEN